MPEIHPSAVVSPRAEIGPRSFVGPYSVIGADVRIGAGVRIESHCVVDGMTTIGDETHIYPFVSIGLASQDLKYRGEPPQPASVGAIASVNLLLFIAGQRAAGCSPRRATIASSWLRRTSRMIAIWAEA